MRCDVFRAVGVKFMALRNRTMYILLEYNIKMDLKWDREAWTRLI